MFVGVLTTTPELVKEMVHGLSINDSIKIQGFKSLLSDYENLINWERFCLFISQKCFIHQPLKTKNVKMVRFIPTKILELFLRKGNGLITPSNLVLCK